MTLDIIDVQKEEEISGGALESASLQVCWDRVCDEANHTYGSQQRTGGRVKITPA